MAINDTPLLGYKFGAMKNAELQGGHLIVKHFEAVGVATGDTTVTGLKAADVVLFVYNATDNTDVAVTTVKKGYLTLPAQTDSDVLIVCWLTER